MLVEKQSGNYHLIESDSVVGAFHIPFIHSTNFKTTNTDTLLGHASLCAFEIVNIPPNPTKSPVEFSPWYLSTV